MCLMCVLTRLCRGLRCAFHPCLSSMISWATTSASWTTVLSSTRYLQPPIPAHRFRMARGLRNICLARRRCVLLWLWLWLLVVGMCMRKRVPKLWLTRGVPAVGTPKRRRGQGIAGAPHLGQSTHAPGLAQASCRSPHRRYSGDLMHLALEHASTLANLHATARQGRHNGSHVSCTHTHTHAHACPATAWASRQACH